jgi:hypothetical protein
MIRRDFINQAARGTLTILLTGVAGRLPRAFTQSGSSQSGLFYYRLLPPPQQVVHLDVDICVYGATVAGIAAAIQARRMGKSVVLLAFDGHLGGMTASGLGHTDVGEPTTIGGIAREFYQQMGRTYHQPESFFFEPRVAEQALGFLLDAAKVDILYWQRLTDVDKQGARITAITTEGGHTFRARYFIDASYEGDLMAASGIGYTIGRESNATYGETLNGVTLPRPGNNFLRPVNPYEQPSNPKSALLDGISLEPAGKVGQGDHRVQAYNFRLCLTPVPDRLPFPKPNGYDPDRYDMLARYIVARGGTTDALNLNNYLPGHKIDLNSNGAFSSDNIGANYLWPDGAYTDREAIFQDHVSYQQGLMWFLANDPRVPATIQAHVRIWGLPRDEFTDTGGWPHQLYVREARRMVSDYVMTEHHCRRFGRVLAPDSIGMASYNIDAHHCQRIVRLVGGVSTAWNEGQIGAGPILPFGISYRSIVPRERQSENVLVPVCLSASHVAWGSIRMEPVFFILGQSAGTAACLAADAGGIALQAVDINDLQQRLRKDGQVLELP